MEFWLPLIHEPVDQIVELARTAEQVGIRGIALADHVAVPIGFATAHPGGESMFDHRAPWIDPLVTAATILATTNIEVLSYVYVLCMREPFSVAKQVATLSTLSGGRFRFGVGVGWLREEIELFGHDARVRGRRTDEMLEIVRRFWRDGVAEFHGEFFNFGPTSMFPLPSPVPRVWIGGESDAALARAASADGWIGMTYEIDQMWRLLDRVRDARSSSGKSVGDSFELMITPTTGPSHELLKEMDARGVTSTLMMPWYPGDPEWIDLGKKREALKRFANEFIRTE